MKNGEERYQRYIDYMPIIGRYNTFMMAKKLGIKYSPHDISYQDLKYFYIIDQTLNKDSEKNLSRK